MYVVVKGGLTGCEPCGRMMLRPGSIATSNALRTSHVIVAKLPDTILPGVTLNMATSGRLKDGAVTCAGPGVTTGGGVAVGEDAGGVSAGAGDAGGATIVTHPAARTVINIKTTKIFLIEHLLLPGSPDNANHGIVTIINLVKPHIPVTFAL